MTDKQTFLAMLKKADIRYSIDNTENSITIEAGYVGFVSIISFNEDNSLKSIEAYE